MSRMQGHLSLQTWLEVLRSIALIEGFLHVGAGKCGDARRFVSCSVKQPIFLEADEDPASASAAVVDKQPTWHAGYPDLPIVLQSPINHQVDVLLDDFNRQEEKEVAERWVGVLKKVSISYQKAKLAFEKDACLLSIG